jgi:hypothetical protein
MGPDDALTALYSKVKQHKILVYDLESKDGETQDPGFTRVFLGGLFDGVNFYTFRNHVSLTKTTDWEMRAVRDGGCIDQMMRKCLTKEYRGHYIYAHNGGAFDHLHILPWLRARVEEFEIVIVPIQSTIQVLKVTHRTSKSTWNFLDSIRLLPMSLDKAAKTFGFPGKLTHSLRAHEDDPSWEKYLKRDCEALFQSLTEFQRLVIEVMGGEMGITTPSTAMKLYRRRFMGHGKTPAMIPHHRHFKDCTTPGCHGCLHAWIRTGYCGGRTEAFRKRGEKLSYYDINSSYAASMCEDMPGGVVKQYGPKKGVSDFRRLEKAAIGFVECEVEIPATCYLPPLPYRDEKTGKLLFPTGRFKGVFSWEELKLLDDPLVKGRITNVIRSVWYGRKTLFFDYVKDLYAYRDKSLDSYEEGLAAIAKLMLTSLYGKFGMNEDRREIIVLMPGEKPPEGSTFPRFEDGQEDLLSRVCYVEKHVSPPYIIPQISSHITALSRVRLWHHMATVLRMGGSLYYCDTDSLITDIDNLPTSTELGALKNEYPGEVLDVELMGPKMYMLRKATAFKGEHHADCKCHQVCKGEHDAKEKHDECKGCSRVKLAMKGIPKDKRTEATAKLFKKGDKVYFGRLEKLGAMAERGFLTPPRMRQTSKTHHGRNDKRIFRGENDSVPIHLFGGDTDATATACELVRSQSRSAR